MKNKKLNVISIAFCNLVHQSIRTTIMVIFSFIIAAVLLVSTILSASQEKCIENTLDQMGADIIVVPTEYVADYTDAFFSGSLCGFYFDKSWYDEIKEIDGIKQATPQLYIATLPADCCSDELQIIAFDSETDFIVKPWLKDLAMDGVALKDGEIITGKALNHKVGDTLMFLGVASKVAGVLKETGTDYDNCIFVNFSTAEEMLESEQLREVTHLKEDSDSVISSIMIRVSDRNEIDTVLSELDAKLEGSPLKAFTPNQMVSNLSESVDTFSSFSNLLSQLMFVVVAFAIVCIFSITILQRKHEFGVLITLGVTRGKMIAIILTEGILIGLVGGILGVLSAGGIMLAFKEIILLKLSLPTLIVDNMFYVITALKCVGVSVVAGAIASCVAITLICCQEPLKLIKEGNA